MSSDTSSLRFRVLAAFTAFAAVLSLGLSAASKGVGDIEILAVLTVLALLAESLTVTLPNGGYMSMAYPLSVSALVLLGPTGGALVATMSCLPHAISLGRARFGTIVFDASQVAVAAVVSGWVYVGLVVRFSGRQPSIHEFGRGLDPKTLPVILFAVLMLVFSSLLINYLFVGLYYRIREGAGLRTFWRSTVVWTIPTQIALGMVGFAIAQITAAVGLLGLALFAVPLMVSRQTYQRYGALKKAYADTVRSLVAAIEAKDQYTKGHSLRVAEYAVAAAKAMNLDENDVECIERAALLHDVGKVGIRRAILDNPSALTEAEYSIVKRHPDIGARILESVPHLADIVPIVKSHHERFDGAGYGHGLAGDEILLLARILAVADSFDAMTSRRSYREALSFDDAVQELRSSAGTQFDASVVDAFVAGLPGVWETSQSSSFSDRLVVADA